MSQEKERISWRFNTFHTPSTPFAKITIYGLVVEDKRKKETLKATVNKKENSMLNVLEEIYIIINVRRGGKFARKSRLKA